MGFWQLQNNSNNSNIIIIIVNIAWVIYYISILQIVENITIHTLEQHSITFVISSSKQQFSEALELLSSKII